MSVLIKGMKMTKDCRDCLMTEYLPVTGNTWCKPADRCLAKNYKPIQFDGRPDWCPMVELQSAQPVDEDINVPCKDAISRQAAIDALGEEPPVWYEGEDEVAERNQWRRDVEAIKTLPSNEKLPRFYQLSCNRIPTEKNNRLTQHENMLRHNGQPVLCRNVKGQSQILPCSNRVFQLHFLSTPQLT